MASKPQISIENDSVEEGGELRFKVKLSRAADRDITVNYATYAGTASTADGDYTGTTNSSIVIRAGKTTGTIEVQTKEDSRVEPDETMSVRVESISYGEIADGRGDGTIRNDDRAVLPRLKVADAAVQEGDKLSFQVTLDRAADRDITVNYATYAGTASTADGDYTGTTNSSIVIRAGKTTGTIEVQTKEDSRVEPDETMSVRVGSISYGEIADGRGDGTIRNDDIGAGLKALTDQEWDKASGEPNYLGGRSSPVSAIVSAFWAAAPVGLESLVEQHTDSFREALLDGPGHTTTSGYYYDQLYINSFKEFHAGIDFDGFKGDTVSSPISGEVTYVGLLNNKTDTAYDRGIVIHDDRLGLDWLLGHITVLADFGVGDHIEIGDKLGVLLDYPSKGCGDGDHLHVEVHGSWSHGTNFWGSSSDGQTILRETVSPLQAYFQFLDHSG